MSSRLRSHSSTVKILTEIHIRGTTLAHSIISYQVMNYSEMIPGHNGRPGASSHSRRDRQPGWCRLFKLPGIGPMWPHGTDGQGLATSTWDESKGLNRSEPLCKLQETPVPRPSSPFTHLLRRAICRSQWGSFRRAISSFSPLILQAWLWLWESNRKASDLPIAMPLKRELDPPRYALQGKSVKIDEQYCVENHE